MHKWPLEEDEEKLDNEKQSWMKGHVRNLFTVSLSFWNQRVLQRNQSRHRCHSMEGASKNTEVGSSSPQQEDALTRDDVLMSNPQAQISSSLPQVTHSSGFDVWERNCWGFSNVDIHFLHRYLLMIKMFCPSVMIYLAQIWPMMTRGQTWAVLFLFNVLSSDFVLLPVAPLSWRSWVWS